MYFVTNQKKIIKFFKNTYTKKKLSNFSKIHIFHALFKGILFFQRNSFSLGQFFFRDLCPSKLLNANIRISHTLGGGRRTTPNRCSTPLLSARKGTVLEVTALDCPSGYRMLGGLSQPFVGPQGYRDEELQCVGICPSFRSCRDTLSQHCDVNVPFPSGPWDH